MFLLFCFLFLFFLILFSLTGKWSVHSLVTQNCPAFSLNFLFFSKKSLLFLSKNLQVNLVCKRWVYGYRPGVVFVAFLSSRIGSPLVAG